jgi:hypothetical protein
MCPRAIYLNILISYLGDAPFFWDASRFVPKEGLASDYCQPDYLEG